MPRLTVEGFDTVTVDEGKRLVLAIEELGIHIGHRCGGNARCTTCRVQFEEGEPDRYTRAEYAKLKERGLLGQYRLSCQHTLTHDMTVRPIMTLESEGWVDTGPAPAETVTPEARWYTLEELHDSGPD